MFSASRTIFLLLQTNGLLCESHNQMCQYSYTVLLWILLHGFSHYTVSIDRITCAKCRIGALFLGGIQCVRLRAACKVSLDICEYGLHSAAQNLLCKYGM
jgi:hypothetical protein